MESTYYSRWLKLSLFLFGTVLISCATQEVADGVQSSNALNEVPVKYATGLRVWENDDIYKVVVRNPQDTTELLGTYWISKSDSLSKGDTLAGRMNAVALNSTTFGSYFTSINRADAISGMTYLDRVMNPEIKRLEGEGAISELTSAGELDFEKVVSVNPDALMAYSFGESDFSRFEEQGIPVIMNMEYMESLPLGRAEWIKMVGCLTGDLQKALDVFTEVESNYLELRRKAALSSYAPSVFTGSRFKDFWYAPGNDSYIANYIRHAGAVYSFSQYPGNGSQELEYEGALEAISSADFWGLVVFESEPFTMENVVEMNELYANFESYKKGNVFVCNATTSDYFGEAVMEPHVVLADLINILHPTYLPNHQPKYFFDLTP